MKKIAVLGLAFALALSAAGLAGCGQNQQTGGEPAEPETPALSGTITIQGSDTMVNLATAWAEKFMDENPEVEVTVQGGGSGTGIAALINGTVDFANASREMKEEEIAEAESKGINPVEHKVAIDGIAVIVNAANPVEALTMEQLGKIFRGEITNWKEVGGPDKPIVLLSRDSSSGTYEYFKEEVVGKDKEYAKTAKLLPSSQAIVDEVKANEAGIGYVGLGYISDDVKVVAIDGVKASVETAKDGTYPIARYLYMYSNGEVDGLLKAYLDWVLGPEGQALVADEGFVPLQ
ncbi:MAG: phosphate ABC transporter substrate-binding protein [Anaerosomatales bacterium]|nr:phosphate ABC transporter substrate-binding protein [Anaerosomatales bacterium]